MICGSYFWNIFLYYHQDFQFLERFLPHLSGISVCECNEVEMYFHPSKMENDLPQDSSLMSPIFTLVLLLCHMKTVSQLCVLSHCLLSVAVPAPHYYFIRELDMGRAHLFMFFFHLSLCNFRFLLMHFRISLCSSVKSPVRIWIVIALN